MGIVAVLILAYVYSVNSYKGIPAPVLLLAIAAVLMAYAANNTRFGRYTYAIGGNREAARLSGVDIRHRISSFRTDGISVRRSRASY